MNMMVNTSELVANEAETKKIAGTELKKAVSKLVASSAKTDIDIKWNIEQIRINTFFINSPLLRIIS